MGGGEYPGITIDPEGLERLPEEARAPCEAILRKKRRGGHDIGRLFLFNAIAAYNGGRFLTVDEAARLVAKLKGKSLDAYNEYRRTYDLLEECMIETHHSASEAKPAITGLQMIAEAIEYANADYPACKWNKYGIDEDAEPFPTLARVTNLRGQAIEGITNCLRIHEMFKVYGHCVGAPGLETALKRYTKEMEYALEAYNLAAARAYATLEARPLSSFARKTAREWLAPLPTEWRKITQRVLAEAERRLKKLSLPDAFGDIENIFLEAEENE